MGLASPIASAKRRMCSRPTSKVPSASYRRPMKSRLSGIKSSSACTAVTDADDRITCPRADLKWGQRAAMRQLSGVDALHVLEETRRQHMHTIKIAILGPRDGAPLAAGEIRSWARDRLPSIPPMRWKVLKIPLGLGRPVFVDAGRFDVDRHIRVEQLSAPGDDRQFDEVVSRVASIQLPRDRPLWELTIVEGLSGGRTGLVFKL